MITFNNYNTYLMNLIFTINLLYSIYNKDLLYLSLYEICIVFNISTKYFMQI